MVFQGYTVNGINGYCSCPSMWYTTMNMGKRTSNQPYKSSYWKVVNKIKRDGIVKDEINLDSPLITSDVMRRIIDAVTCNRKSSTQRLSRNLDILNSTFWKSLCYQLNKTTTFTLCKSLKLNIM